MTDHATYPFFDLYPSGTLEDVNYSFREVEYRLKTNYPHFNICTFRFTECYLTSCSHFEDPAVYPYFDIYFRSQQQTTIIDIEEVPKLNAEKVNYPYLVICKKILSQLREIITLLLDPPVYPNFDMYPTLAGLVAEEACDDISVKLPTLYPTLEICKGTALAKRYRLIAFTRSSRVS